MLPTKPTNWPVLCKISVTLETLQIQISVSMETFTWQWHTEGPEVWAPNTRTINGYDWLWMSCRPLNVHVSAWSIRHLEAEEKHNNCWPWITILFHHGSENSPSVLIPTTSLVVMGLEYHDENGLWHYTEKLPSLMPQIILYLLLFVLSLYIFDSLFLSFSAKRNKKTAVSFLSAIAKHPVLVLRGWRMRRSLLHHQSWYSDISPQCIY